MPRCAAAQRSSRSPKTADRHGRAVVIRQGLPVIDASARGWVRRTCCHHLSVLCSRRGGYARGSRPNAAAHNPAPLGNLSVAVKSELLKQVLRAGVKVGASLRFATIDLFGVGLHEPAPGFLDRFQSASHGRPRDPRCVGVPCR